MLPIIIFLSFSHHNIPLASVNDSDENHDLSIETNDFMTIVEKSLQQGIRRLYLN